MIYIKFLHSIHWKFALIQHFRIEFTAKELEEAILRFLLFQSHKYMWTNSKRIAFVHFCSNKIMIYRPTRLASMPTNIEHLLNLNRGKEIEGGM